MTQFEGFGWGFLFGVFLLFQKMMVIIIIGTSIRATNVVLSDELCNAIATHDVRCTISTLQCDTYHTTSH